MGSREAEVGGERRVGLGDDELVLLTRGEVVDRGRDLALGDAAVRGLDEPERVDPRERGERADQTDVRAFRRLDRAHAAVVAGVDVANLDAGALTRQTTRAEGRETPLVRQARERVVLVHELRQLAGSEELLDRGDDGAHVDQGLRRDRLDVLRGHALAHDALHAAQARADLVLDELADRADAAVAEVVDVVHVEADVDLLAVADTREGLLLGVQRDEVLDRRDDVVDREHRVTEVRVDPELAVDLVATHLRQVVALRVEVEVVEQRTRGLGGDLLARTELAVDVLERLLLGEDGVLLQRRGDRLVAGEVLEDLFAREAECLEEDGDRLLALAVDANADLVALVDLELEPRTAARDDASGVDVLVGGLLHLALEVDARAADELRDDDTLGAVDDEGAALSHEREVAHEDGLGLDLARHVVHELGVDIERRGEGLAALLALVDRVLRLFELGLGERQLHRLAEVLDRADLFEDLVEARGLGNRVVAGRLRLGRAGLPGVVADKPVKALGLQREKVGDRQRVSDLGERQPRCGAAVLEGLLTGCGARSNQGKQPP